MSPQQKHVQQAKREYEHAAERLMTVTERVYPIGAIIDATMGRARIRAEVIRHAGHTNHEPAAIIVRNVDTGKNRRLSASFDDHDIEIVSLPEE